MDWIRTSLMASLTLHVAMLLFFHPHSQEPANSITWQGKAKTLSVHMLSASPPTSPTADTAKPKTRLPVSKTGEHPPAIRSEGRTAPRPTKPVVPRPVHKTRQEIRKATGNNQGKERQDNEEGSATRNTLQPVTGNGVDEMAAYAARLRREIESHKRYPVQARQAHISGVVNIRFTVQDDGNLTDPHIIASSGNRTLDAAALRAIRQSGSVGPRPQNFGRSVNITIRFTLKP